MTERENECWVGQKVCLGFSVRWYGKIGTNFLANPVCVCVCKRKIACIIIISQNVNNHSNELWGLFHIYMCVCIYRERTHGAREREVICIITKKEDGGIELGKGKVSISHWLVLGQN